MDDIRIARVFHDFENKWFETIDVFFNFRNMLSILSSWRSFITKLVIKKGEIGYTIILWN